MNFEILLKEHHLKITAQRLGILSFMHKAGHISVEDLFVQLKKEFSSISLATLYKNVHAMLGVNLVKEVKIPHDKSKYEITKAPHAHLLCESCGKFEDIFLDVDSMIKNASKQSDYQLKESSIIYSGICPNCQKNSL